MCAKSRRIRPRTNQRESAGDGYGLVRMALVPRSALAWHAWGPL